MELIEGIKARRSVRKFEDKAVAHEVVEEIVDAARFAPSWKNVQIARYIVVEDKDVIAKLAAPECVFNFEYNIKTIQGAAAVVIETYKTGRSGFERDGSFSTPKGDGFEMFDAGIAAQTFCLAAADKGVGTVIMGYFDEDEIRKVVEIPEGQKIASVICMGYPAKDPAPTPRKEVSELLTYI